MSSSDRFSERERCFAVVGNVARMLFSLPLSKVLFPLVRRALFQPFTALYFPSLSGLLLLPAYRVCFCDNVPFLIFFACARVCAINVRLVFLSILYVVIIVSCSRNN